ncbi:MAG TPA: lipid-binding SYLF domain-containing protein [Thermodesulfobacteriota bacterium]|nr:lipid-binding SYLF domain-containing protein [Thermodesulfobacteriota bacterium]
MRTRPFLCMLAVILTMLFNDTALAAEGDEARKVEAAAEVLREIMEVPEKGLPESLFHEAYGIAVIPEVIKVGFVVGGRWGRGVVVVRDSSGGWSDPSFVTITGGSVGWQIGAQSTDVILVFKSSKGVEGMTRGKFTLGADAAIAAGPVGRQAEAATDAQLKAEIYSYSRSRGLFAGVSLEGSALQIDDEWNGRFYGKDGITPGEIFTGKAQGVPAVVDKLKDALSR